MKQKHAIRNLKKVLNGLCEEYSNDILPWNSDRYIMLSDLKREYCMTDQMIYKYIIFNDDTHVYFGSEVYDIGDSYSLVYYVFKRDFIKLLEVNKELRDIIEKRKKCYEKVNMRIGMRRLYHLLDNYIYKDVYYF